MRETNRPTLPEFIVNQQSPYDGDITVREWDRIYEALMVWKWQNVFGMDKQGKKDLTLLFKKIDKRRLEC